MGLAAVLGEGFLLIAALGSSVTDRSCLPGPTLGWKTRIVSMRKEECQMCSGTAGKDIEM